MVSRGDRTTDNAAAEAGLSLTTDAGRAVRGIPGAPAKSGFGQNAGAGSGELGSLRQVGHTRARWVSLYSPANARSFVSLYWHVTRDRHGSDEPIPPAGIPAVLAQGDSAIP